MYRLAVVLACVLSACTSHEPCGGPAGICVNDTPPPDYDCDLFTQSGCAAGEKCTWLRVANDSAGYGRVGCAPDGAAKAGDACTYKPEGQGGFDNCMAGNVCNIAVSATVCEPICSVDGTTTTCGSTAVCVADPYLFTSFFGGAVVAGVCRTACNPLDDNDFDGVGSASTKVGNACGTDPGVGCYGLPRSAEPMTAFTCMPDAGESRRHRSRVDALAQTFANHCSQGYAPLLMESTDVTELVCVALCEPMNCYAGNCGPNDENRLGAAPHRCTATDRVGSFDTSANGEHCRYLWSLEIDDQNGFLPSEWSDKVGFCFDHSKYGSSPPCATLPDGFGSGSTLGAADLGCVDTTHAQLAPGQVPRRRSELRLLSSPRRP